MPQVEIYTTAFCPYCHRAKALLARKGVAFEEIDVTMDPVGRKQMTERAGGRTSVPQVFLGESHLGGCDDLHALDATGELDRILEGA